MPSFDAPEELGDFVEGDKIFDKIELVIETQNKVIKARMILDTKESWLKKVTTKTQRVILPRLLDAFLRMLFLLSLVCSAGEAISGIVLDYSDVFSAYGIPATSDTWRIPGLAVLAATTLTGCPHQNPLAAEIDSMTGMLLLGSLGFLVVKAMNKLPQIINKKETVKKIIPA